MEIHKQNNSHTTPPQTHIAFIVPRFKGIGSFHKSGTGNNQVRQQTNPWNNRCYNCNDCHSKINELSLPVISVSPPFNNSVIDPSQLSSFCQQSSRSSHKNPSGNRCSNSKDINSKSNELPSPLIHVPPTLNVSIINPTQLSSVCQKSSSSSHNTTHELLASSIPVWASPDPSNNMPPPSTNNRSRNIYACMVDVSKLTPVQRQKHVVMLLQHYHKLCNKNFPSSMFLSTTPITNI